MFQLKFNCPMDSNKMPKQKNGFYCKVCNKSIIDFTKMENAKIKTILAEQTEAICGVYKKDTISNPKTSQLSSAFRLAFAAIFILGLSLYHYHI